MTNWFPRLRGKNKRNQKFPLGSLHGFLQIIVGLVLLASDEMWRSIRTSSMQCECDQIIGFCSSSRLHSVVSVAA